MRYLLKIALIVTMAVVLAMTAASAVQAVTDSVNVSVTINNYITISNPSDVNLSAISGTGGSSESTAAWTVTTNNALGYQLTLNASASPAMTSGANSIADYTPAVADTPETWSVAVTDSEFGFSAQGTDTPTGTWGTPGSGTGKYRNFNGTTPVQIASKSQNTTTSGETTTAYLKVQVGTSHFQPSGTYSATITATATTL